MSISNLLFFLPSHVLQGCFPYTANTWYERYKDFLTEKTLNEVTGKKIIHMQNLYQPIEV